MNTLVKSAVAGALMLGGSSAFAIGSVSSNASGLFLYVDAFNAAGTSTGVYAVDTGVTLNQLMPSSGFSQSAVVSNNSTAFTGVNKSITAATSGLNTFLSAHSSDTIQWTLAGGQYKPGSTSFATPPDTVKPGQALAVFTSPILQKQAAGGQAATNSNIDIANYLNNINFDLSSSGGIGGLLTASSTTGTETSGAASHYGWFPTNDLAATGTTVKLFGLTGNGVNGGTVQSYILGSGSLDAAGNFTLTANSTTTAPVPLPAAVWLFGSGLMGLVGVSRRRKAAAAA